jgi:hypothetical protein
MDAFVADPAGAFLTTPAGAPVLAAHRLLADLAQIYFEEPNASPRSVVLTENGDVNPELLNVVLNGLNSDAYVKSSTVGQLFAINPSADSSTSPLSLPNTVSTTNSLSTKALAKAANEFGVISSVVPANTTLLSTLNNDLTFAKAYGLSPRAAASYLNASSEELATIAKSLAFLGKRFTLTAATGKIPITIQQSAGVGTIDVVVRLESSNLVILHGSGTPESLQSDATTLTDVEVDTEGSGVKTLIVKVMSPRGNDVLLSAEFKVYSTAISGVAVGISILSLVILGAWWLRSARRKRRGKAHALTQP